MPGMGRRLPDMRLVRPFICGLAALLAACGRPEEGRVAASLPAPEAAADLAGRNGAFEVRRPGDPIAALRAAFDAGLRFDGGAAKPFLRRMLAEAGVDERSQVLVFSKTSFQNEAISRAAPRALYFSDDCYVGMVQGGALEVAVADGEKGTSFFSVDFRADPAGKPKWDSPARCLDCHEGSMTDGRPGLMVRSVFTDAASQPISSAGGFQVTHATPLADRWGGWFVTGHHGAARHMGNAVAAPAPGGNAVQNREKAANLRTLEGWVDTRPYLRSGSDIVALMVLEHQATLHNAYTQASLSVREQVMRHRAVRRELGQADDQLSPQIQGMIRSQARKIVGLMLFKDEAPLPEGGVDGDPAFQEAFRANRKEAKAGAVGGKSLKDFQLLTRLFRCRCSYTVYSRAFDLMDPLVKEEVWRELRLALTADDELSRHLPAAEKARILDILRQTKAGLPTGW